MANARRVIGWIWRATLIPRGTKLADVSAEYQSDMLAQMRAYRARHAEAIAHARTRLVIGVPSGRILEVAEDEGARMIVMGSLGRTGLPHLFLGSKAQRVAQLSPIPVTIVKAAPEADE